MKRSKWPRVAYVKHLGDVKEAMTLDGFKIYSRPKVNVPGYGMITCAPYGNHFVYLHPNFRRRLGWGTFCTCGSPAVIVGYDAYKKDASNQGAMLVCYWHATTGKHADGSR